MATSEQLFQAELLIKRWAWFVRRGLPDLGYPHKAPFHISAHGRQELEVLPEDDLTAVVMCGLSLRMKEVARLRWVIVLSQKEVAAQARLSRRQVRTRLYQIKKCVANHVYQ